MNFIFTDKSSETGHGAGDYARAKLEDVLGRMEAHPLRVELTFSDVKQEKHVHLHLHQEHGDFIELHEKGPNFQFCIDSLHDHLKRQMRKNKEKQVSKKMRQFKNFNERQPELEDSEVDE